MQRTTLLTLITLLATPTLSFGFFCPTNFNQINVGDSPDQVIQQCGKPDNRVDSKKANDNVPQQWSYYIPQTVSTNTAHYEKDTLKTSLTFDQNDKEINISVNGIGVGSTTV